METKNLVLNLEEIQRKYSNNPLEYFKNKKLCLFKACLEKYFPGVRWGMFDLLESFNLDITTCLYQSCCSGTFFQRNLITRAQFAAINERNIMELNQQADIVLFSCNGCYNSILRGRDFLKNQAVRIKTQEILNDLKREKETFGAYYENKYDILDDLHVKVVHDLDFLHLIRNQIVNKFKFDLGGLKVAIHYGCHYLNLERDKKIKDGHLESSYFRNKNKLEDMVELFGGVPVDYMEKESCCGWGASQVVLHLKEALQVTYNKLKSAEISGADFVLMPCPTCLYTLSKPEYRDKIEKWYGERLDIPTIHINELIAILRGCEEERCVNMRRTDPRIHEIYEIITQS